MKKIRMNIPYIELSMAVEPNTTVEKSILTPFGVVEITVEKVKKRTTDDNLYEIRIDGDTDKWIYDEKLHEEFKESLINFLKCLVLDDICKLVDKPGKAKLIMKFKQSEILIKAFMG